MYKFVWLYETYSSVMIVKRCIFEKKIYIEYNIRLSLRPFSCPKKQKVELYSITSIICLGILEFYGLNF